MALALEIVEHLSARFGGSVVCADLSAAEEGTFVISVPVETFEDEQFAVDWAS